jgi:hypothetical protein
VPRRQVAILAYGSLISEPGPGLRPLIVDRVPCLTPFPVEFGRASQRWGGGPVLVPHADGGPVAGRLLVLHPAIGLGRAVDLLAAREGLSSGAGVIEVDMPGPLMVIAAALPRNLPAPEVRPPALARRAASSVSAGPRNGVAYLRIVMDAGVSTPLTARYADAVLALSGAETLEGAERRLVAFARSAAEGGIDGLG